MTRKDDEGFENSTKCYISDNGYVDGDLRVKDHFHITRKYRGSLLTNCNIKIKLNHKTPIVFHNIKIYDLYLIIQK